jgi:hypothetical protein
MDDLQMLVTLLAKPDPSHDVVDRRRHQLQKAMRGPVRRRRTGWLAGGLGLTAAAATAAVVVASGTTAPTATPNSPPAAGRLSGRQILLAAATTAERAPASSGTYWYVRTVITDGKDGKPLQWETWTRRDGQTWFRGEKTQNKMFKEAIPSPFGLAGVKMSVEQIQKLPTDPAALRASLAKAVKHSDIRTSAGRLTAGDQKVWVMDALTALVSQLPAPPKVRATAFRAIASLPNVKSLGPVKGGQGLLISSDTRLVVDPATARVNNSNFLVSADGGELRTPATGGASIVAEWTNVLPK